MPVAPIVVRCPCGVETRAGAGDAVTCTGCGARYDTAAEAQTLNMLANRTQRQFRYLSRAGLGAVGLAGLAGLSQFQVPGLVVGAGVVAFGWYVLLMPRMKRRMLAKAATLFTPVVAPKRR
ncbi:MAG: hypothetical protein ACKO7Q_06320 [Actinomycetota bacterium]